MFQNNPYNVLSKTISFENVQQIGEMLTLKTLRGLSKYPQVCYQQLYLNQIVSALHFYIRKMAAILCVDNRRFFMIAHLE